MSAGRRQRPAERGEAARAGRRRRSEWTGSEAADRVDGHRVASVPAGRRSRPASASAWSAPDDLPDGLVIADHVGRVIGLQPGRGPADRHRRARRARPGRPAGAPAAGRRGPLLVGVAPTRTAACPPAPGTPSARCYLPDGTEFLVTMGYVRVPGRSPGGPDWHRSSRARSAAS